MPDDSSDELIYLGLDAVLQAHATVLQCTVEQARDHLRSVAAVEGALARPLWQAHYANADIALQAAVLAEGIAESQPFVDGNKRDA